MTVLNFTAQSFLIQLVTSEVAVDWHEHYTVIHLSALQGTAMNWRKCTAQISHIGHRPRSLARKLLQIFYSAKDRRLS